MESALFNAMGTVASIWAAWIGPLLAVATPIVLVIFRSPIAEWITKGVQHEFDVKLEKIRATLKASEEELKSDLREKEAEIGILRNTVLSGSASRQALLDKRRLEAVEKIWTAVNDSVQLKNLFSMTVHLNYEAIAERIQESKIQRFLETIDTTGPSVELKNSARDERPFVPEIAWAYFSAFTTLLTFNLVRFKTLKLGLEEPQKFVNVERMKNILKAACPTKLSSLTSKIRVLTTIFLRKSRISC